MEPSNSQILGAASEECHSCESGWTLYLGSPTHDDGDDHSDDDEEQEEGEGEDRKGCGAAEDDESDDSMASDASSGPSHHIHIGNSKGNQLVKEDVAAVITKEKEIAEKKVEKKETAFMYQSHKGKVGVKKMTKNHCIRGKN